MYITVSDHDLLYSIYHNRDVVLTGAASSNGQIVEVGMNFNEYQWYQWQSFEVSDTDAGVGSALDSNNVGHVYFRNKAKARLQQWTWSYNENNGWYAGK